MSFVAYSVSVLHDLWGQHSTSCVSLEIALCSAWLRYDRINQTFSAGILIWWCCVFLHQGYQGLNLNWEGTLGLWARLPKIKHKIYIKKWTALYICVCVCVNSLTCITEWVHLSLWFWNLTMKYLELARKEWKSNLQAHPLLLQVLGTDELNAYLNKYRLELDPHLAALVGRLVIWSQCSFC